MNLILEYIELYLVAYFEVWDFEIGSKLNTQYNIYQYSSKIDNRHFTYISLLIEYCHILYGRIIVRKQIDLQKSENNLM